MIYQSFKMAVKAIAGNKMRSFVALQYILDSEEKKDET